MERWRVGCSWGQAECKAALLALGGSLLAFSAPAHRLDLVGLGAAAAAAGVVWRPAVGPLLVGAALPCYFFPRALGAGLSLSPPGFLLLLGWAGVLVGATRDRLAGSAPAARWCAPATGYDAPLALFLLAALLSLLVTEYPVLSARDLRALVLEPVGFFWLLAVLRRQGAVPAALAGFLVAASLAAVAALGQLALGIGGTEAEGVRRVQAWYPSPNHLALTLGRALPYLVAFSVASPPRIPAVAAWAPSLLVAAALLLTFAGGGWLGGGAGVLVVLLALGRRRLALRLGGLAAALLLAVSLLALAGALPQRLSPLRQTGVLRLELWSSSLEMLRDHPLLGVGLDNFLYLYQQVYLHEAAAAEPNLSHPHNWLLHVWLQLGLPGLLAFLWLLRRFWRRAGRALRSPTSVGRAALSAGALGSMADLLAHGLIDNSYFLVDLAFLFWLTLAIPPPEAES